MLAPNALNLWNESEGQEGSETAWTALIAGEIMA